MDLGDRDTVGGGKGNAEREIADCGVMGVMGVRGAILI